MTRNQDGFSVVEGLIVVIVIIALVLTGWLVLNRDGKQPTKKASTTVQSTTKHAAAQSAASAKTASGSQSNARTTPAKSLQNCIASSLSLSVGTPQETAGTIYTNITLTNTYTQSCILSGYPTVALTDAQGNDLGKPADGNGPSGNPVTLAPNQSATAVVSVPNPGFLSPGACTTNAAYILVNAPNDPRYVQANYNEAYCPGFAVTAFK